MSGSAFTPNRYSIQRYYPSPFPFTSNVSPKLIRLSQWCKENHFTRKQAYRLIYKKHLLCLRQNRVLWVAENPDCPIPPWEKC